MKNLFVLVTAALSAAAWSQDRSETRELLGKVGTRSALLVLHATQRPDGGWQVAGEYVLLPTLARRFVEGERSPELGVTTLKEGTTPILFGRPATGELRGTWREGAFKGMRYGPGGQRREDFEFSEEFPSMERYGLHVRCATRAPRYESSLILSVEAGKLKNLEWRSRLAPSGHGCNVAATGQEPLRGGLRFSAGECRVTARDLGEFIVLAAADCASLCGSEAYLEPLLIDGRGHCQLLRQEARP